MQWARAFRVGAAIAFAAASFASMASTSGAASAAGTSGDEADAARRVGPAHRLVLIPAANSMASDFAKGCWVRLYDGKNFRGEELMLVGPLRLAGMGTTSPWWRLWNSVIVGPNARVTIYSDPNYQGRSAALAARQRSTDLGAKELSWSGKIESAQVDCSAS